jgi:hypothetical protein
MEEETAYNELETMRNGAIGLKIFIIIPKFT